MSYQRRVAMFAAFVLAGLVAQWALGRVVGGTDVIAAVLTGKLLAPVAVLSVFVLRVCLIFVAPAWGLALGVRVALGVVEARKRGESARRS